MKSKNTIIISTLAVIVIGFLVWFFFLKTPNTTYTVSFNTDGGSLINDITVKENETVSKPTNPSKSGFTFVEWQLDGVTFNFNTKITKNITLKAVWKVENDDQIEYTVTFDTDGGNDIASQTVASGSKATVPTKPTKNGYTFVKWQLNGSDYDFDTVVSSSITLKAVWTKNEDKKSEDEVTKYTVTFDSNGGSSVTKKTIVSGNKVSKPTDPTKANNKFVKWQLNGADYDFNTPVTKNITLKAVWEETKTYTYKTSNYSESDLMYKVNVYLNGTDITQKANRVYTSGNINLGAYESAAGAILVKKSQANEISKVLIDNVWHTITKQ